MAGDSQDNLRRKHRRLSEDDDADDSTKLRKHRHHHHRHRDHRRSSRKREGEEQPELQVEEEVLLTLPPPSTGDVDYDMEEGEIVDDVGPLKMRSDSDVESKAAGLIAESDKLTITGVNGAKMKLEENTVNGGRGLEVSGEAKGDTGLLVCSNLDVKVKAAADGSSIQNKVPNYMNGATILGSVKENYDKVVESQSPVKTSNRRTIYHVSEDGCRSQSKSMSSGDDRNVQKSFVSSPHDERNKETGYSRDRPKSHDRCRERSRSHENVLDTSMPIHAQDSKKFVSDSEDDDNMIERNRDSQHDKKDISKYKERERSSSYNLYTRHPDRHRSQDREASWDGRHNDREGRDMDRDKKTERHREKDKEDGERQRERDKKRDRRQERDREMDNEKLARDKERMRENDREGEMDRQREREKGREREKERDRDREEWGRKRQREREWEREREDRERRREREDRSRKNEREWENGRDKPGGSGRDRESDRSIRHHKNEKDIDDSYDRYRNYDSKSRRFDESQHSNRVSKNDSEKVGHVKSDHLKDEKEKSKREVAEIEDYEEKVALQLADQEEDDLDRIKEESRRRMQAILEKYKAKPSHQVNKPQPKDSEKENTACFFVDASADRTVLETSDDKIGVIDNNVDEPPLAVVKSPLQNEGFIIQSTSGAGGLGEGSPKSERSQGSFCDDIFGDSPAGVRKTAKLDGVAVERSGLHDNWDDADGYYSYRVGELLDGRYEVISAHGRGVFSTVVRARDLRAGPGDPEEVAIKILRNREAMLKAGKEELIILNKLVGADPENRRHCVRYLLSFKYRDHLCLVFESLHMNLREVLKKFGRNIGLKLTAVRTYAKQLFIALKHLKNCGVLHCDIKPDNMLVNEAKNVLKLCDFGNAMFAGKNEITPYLVSRFYRSPEIILGLPYDHPMDIWSVGCCLFELYSGKVLFPGATNNDMLRLHMELKGPFPKKMLKKGGFIEQHFDQDLCFLATEEDPVTKKTMRRLLPSMKPKDIGTIITGSPGEDPKILANFKDLLERIFVLDPEKRLTVSQALSHPFITGK
ncbi:serine/threonine-protein kinase prpf4B-like [Impatiens glandulifera]|uniref:serine/threonine-protein kinase prpf4B-like n=1 Tax=Impatiens glandulifera TaxID=253017 RepID=UPI001FB1515C|nr:serine/threonine-protein kinase prpf4B-like [Impatiens glandulifera]